MAGIPKRGAIPLPGTSPKVRSSIPSEIKIRFRINHFFSGNVIILENPDDLWGSRSLKINEQSRTHFLGTFHMMSDPNSREGFQHGFRACVPTSCLPLCCLRYSVSLGSPQWVLQELFHLRYVSCTLCNLWTIESYCERVIVSFLCCKMIVFSFSYVGPCVGCHFG